ncbi:hypothetical protein LPB41_00190 [Thalassospira sp. MA62]|nr:hypothetical protein [Thalassospira sp. MA62]
MRTRIGLVAVGVTTTIAAMIATSSVNAQTYFPPNVDKSECALSASEFTNDWTKLSIFSPKNPFGPVYDKTSGMVYVFPANGPDFSANSTNHCDFYKWGAQMFLWLTSTIDDTTTQTSKPTFPVTLPYVFNSEFFYRLSADHKQLLAQGSDETNSSMAVSLRTAKTDEDDSIGQAGETSGVLLTQGVSPSLTYYAVHTNRLYGYFLNLYKTVIEPIIEADGKIVMDPDLARFPTTSVEACSTLAYANSKGFVEHGQWPTFIEHLLCSYYWPGNAPTPTTIPTIAEIEPAVDSLSLAIELKTSWVDAATLPSDKLHKYVRQYQEVPVYDRSNPNRWLLTGTERRELAMVGMHVVGSVEDHPEMIWATIEHEDSAPNSVYYYMDSSGKIVEVKGPTNDTKWTFSEGTVVDEVTEFALSCSGYKKPDTCVEDSDIVGANPVPSTAPLEIPILPSNVTRLHPWGNVQNETDADVISQNTQIISLNNDVRSLVQANNADDPRQYYFLSGAIWTTDGSIPTNDNYDKNTGSTILANTTMETFQQEASCFGCHHASTSADGLGVSHIFHGISATLPKAPHQ